MNLLTTFHTVIQLSAIVVLGQSIFVKTRVDAGPTLATVATNPASNSATSDQKEMNSLSDEQVKNAIQFDSAEDPDFPETYGDTYRTSAPNNQRWTEFTDKSERHLIVDSSESLPNDPDNKGTTIYYHSKTNWKTMSATRMTPEEAALKANEISQNASQDTSEQVYMDKIRLYTRVYGLESPPSTPNNVVLERGRALFFKSLYLMGIEGLEPSRF